MEYEFDEEAEQIQGRLAADNVEEKCQDKEQAEEQEDKTGLDQDDQIKEDEQLPEQEEDAHVQRTETQAKAADAKEAMKKEKKSKEDEVMEEEQKEAEEREEQVDLVDDYQQVLKNKKPIQSLPEEDRMEVEKNIEVEFNALVDQDDFDYQSQKAATRLLFDQWRSDAEAAQESIALLSRFKAETGAASASLCEQLRIVLEP